MSRGSPAPRAGRRARARSGLPLLVVMALGCQRSYWVADADLRQARSAAATGVAGDRIALEARQPEPVYLRYSQLRIDPRGGDPVQVRAPNRRGERLAGAILLGIGATLAAGGVAVIGYGVSLRGRDSVGAGIVAGLGALPLGVGVGLAIPGVVLSTRARDPSDVVPAGDPSMRYFPASQP